MVRPSMTIVCGDSHTSTLGAFGCLAFGIGTSEVEHVLHPNAHATPTAEHGDRHRRSVPHGTSPKDLMLHLIRQFGLAIGAGHAFDSADRRSATCGWRAG